MKKLQAHIASIEKQLTLSAWLKAILISLCLSPFLFFLGGQPLIISAILGFLTVLIAYGLGAFKDQRKRAIQVIHQQAGNMEFSLELLEKKELSIADRLQLERISQQIPPKLSVLGNGLLPYFLGLLGVFLLSLAVNFWPGGAKNVNQEIESKAQTPTESVDSTLPVLLESGEVLIQSPRYTQIPDKSQTDLNVKAMKGARLTWKLSFQNAEEVQVFLVNSNGERLAFEGGPSSFQLKEELLNSGLYSIQAFHDSVSLFQSDFYTLETIPDLNPEILPEEQEQYQFFFLGNNPKIDLRALVSDDFQVNQVEIVATLARGRGENVKFRETRFSIESSPFQKKRTGMVLDVSALDFQPGDELYYYWTAEDNKQPEANQSRTDTYFIKYFDESDDSEEALAGMAINVLPDYFRSQRQIIIDTEKLIKEQETLSEKDFNFRSNEIGYDQKLLRLRYGQYLGEEFESNAGGGQLEGEEGDLLAGYMHLHDQEGEHDHDEKPLANPNESHSHEEEHVEETGIEGLLSEYMHAHDSEEMNTYYEQSTRGALKAALEQMWQAELHLRLFEPEKALPFENKALELLKAVQQKSRVYIKRTGYDPPPLKEEDIRLGGDLDDLGNRIQKELRDLDQQLEPLASSVLGFLLKNELSADEKEVIQDLGSLWSERMQYSELEDWKLLGFLQELEAGKLDKEGQNYLREKLYPFAKNYKTVDASYLSPQALKEAFQKNNR